MTTPVPPPVPGLRVEALAPDASRAAAYAIRRTVFVDEQRVPLELELDDEEDRCLHVIATIDGVPVGTARLNPKSDTEAKVQRVAVLAPWRGRGVGVALMAALEAAARAQQRCTVVLGAQLSALPFYERLGYVAEGPVFDDAGIPHRTMRKVLTEEHGER